MDLKSVADLRSGLVLSRKKAKHNSLEIFRYSVVSLKSFNENGIYDNSFAEKFEGDRKIKEEYFAKRGDILFRLRQPNLAVFVDEEFKDLLTTSLMVIIRVKTKDVNPEFLTHYLNSKFVQNQLIKESSSGAKIPMVKVKDLEKIELKLPDLQTQNKLAKVNELLNRELKLLERLQEKKKRLKQKILEEVLEGIK